jgi:DNA-binding FadR family transcriptional regulator
MEARLRVEPGVVELVVVNATAADFARMHQCLQRAEAATTLAQFELWDAALHQAVAAATHNTLVARIFDLFHEARQHAAFGKLRDRIVTEPLRLDYQRQHRRIVAALEARDAPAAREAVIAHLTCARGNLFGL